MSSIFKGALKLLAGLLFIALLAAVGLWYVVFADLSPLADASPLKGVHVVKDSIVGVGVLDVGDKQVALIDCGNDGDGTAVLEQLSKRGLSADSVVAIFLTHGHRDHTSGCHLFHKAQIYALEADVPLVEGRAASHGPITQFMPAKPSGIRVSHVVHDGEVVQVGTVPVRVLEVPGHTPGSAAYLAESCLFVGDSANVTSWGELVGAPWPFTDDTARNRASVKALDGKLSNDRDSIVAIVPAHSGIVDYSALKRFVP